MADDAPSRSDLDLWRQALRNEWPIPPEVKRRLLQTAINLADPADEETIPAWTPDKEKGEGYTLGQRIRLGSTRDRTKLAALRVLAQFARLNAVEGQLDLARQRLALDADSATGGLAEIHERMAAYVDDDLVDGDGTGPTGPGPGVVPPPAQPA